jgi:hypothetical protein
MNMLNFRTMALWLAMAFIASAQAVPAAPVLDTAGATQCSARGYNTDRDPKGTNVRAGPRATAPVIGRLPAMAKLDDSDEMVGAEFRVFGSKDGWLLIEYKSEKGGTTLRGWMSGRLIGGTIGSLKLRAKPSDDSEVLAALSGEIDGSGYGPDSFEILQVHGCKGKFTEVTIRLAPSLKPPSGKDKPIRGWVGHICSNQLTTCDGGGQ